MEKIEYKIENLQKMTKLLGKALNKLNFHSDPDDIAFVRDSVAARFKILIESTWKVVKLHLEDKGISDISASPNDVIRRSEEAAFLNKEEALQFKSFIKLRNLASHIYDEPQYLLVINAAPDAFSLVTKIIKRIEQERNE